MSSEILSVLEYMEKEKGIPRADMIATIANALKTAAQKGVNSGQELKIDINPKNGQLLYGAGNIANHFYTTDFLNKVESFEGDLEYHIARKKIKTVDMQTGDIIALSPPLIVERSHIDQIFGTLADVLKTL